MAISRTTCPECNQPFKITRLACPACNLAMEGQIELSPLDQLSPEDQAFVMAFVRHHGSIKKMEELVRGQLSHGEKPPECDCGAA